MKKVLLLFLFAVLTINAQSISVVSPDEVKNVDLKPTFKWNIDTTGISKALVYFQIYTDQEKTQPLLANPEILTAGETEFTLNFMLNYGKYCWWEVKMGNDADGSGEIDGAETFDYSDESYFKTLIDLKPTLSYPIGGAVVYSKETDLFWYTGTITSSIIYQIEVETDINNFDGTADYSTTAISYQLTNLIPGETYYWRVRSLNNLGDADANNDEYSEWSNIDSFKVNESLGLIKPILSFPINDVIVYSKTPTLYWYCLSTIQNLNYEIYLFEAGSSPAKIGKTTNTYFEVPASYELDAGKRYEWFVRVYETDSTIYEESNHSFFNTYKYLAGTPVVPIPSYPTNSALVYDAKTTLYWYLMQSGQGLKYYVQYRKDNSDFDSGGNFSEDVISGNLSKEITGLEPSSDYYWRVKSYTGTDYSSRTAESAWSDTADFSTVDFNTSALSKPVNFYPADSSEVYTSSVTLSWTYNNDLTGVYFNVMWSNNSSFTDDSSNGLHSYSDVSSSLTYTINNLGDNVTYYWKVLPVLSGSPIDYSYESDATKFTYKNLYAVKPLKPILLQPSENMATNSKTVYFSWYLTGASEGLKYKLEVALEGWNFDPSNNHSFEYFVTDKFKEVTLPETGNYKWRVTSYLNSPTEADAKTSDTGHFIVVPQSNIVQPVAGNPSRGVSVRGVPELSWFVPKAVSRVKYELEIADNHEMNGAKVISGLNDLKAKVNLESGKKYYWRVRTESNNVYSQYSGIETFKLLSPTNVKSSDEIPAEFKLKANYPNPFNPSTNISFNLNRPGFTKLIIYDILGNEIVTLVNKELDKGNYTYSWNGRDNSNKLVASGAYFARLISGEKSASIKMLLLK